MMIAAPARPHREVKTDFVIEPLFPWALADVAEFIDKQRRAGLGAEDAPAIERRLKWLLLENPLAGDRHPMGYSVRDLWGNIKGVNLCFPSAFLAGERRFFGLCSGSFFVEPSARPMGFYLFKKYLGAPDYKVFFATTCNANSVPLWRSLGGRLIPNSETEYIVPLRLDLMLSAKFKSAFAQFAARCIHRVQHFLTRRTPAFTIEKCEDWDKLAALFRAHRPPQWISYERSREFLEWRYGSNSPAHPCSLYVFRDRQGNEGWFALGTLKRGAFKGAMLLDAVWPRDKVSFKDVFSEITAVAADSAAALFFRR
ncbi:MAG: hypothetical protein JO307_05345, partial [Bryobacterales bacterium]|nr:hypothetical protein [Bryobacterales bacterium]